MAKIKYMEVTSYHEANKQADVVRTVGQSPNYYGCRYNLKEYNDQHAAVLGIQWFPNHSEQDVHDAASDYVKGRIQYSIN